MKLLLKVVKSSQVISDGDTVHIDNTVQIQLPPMPELTEEEMDEAQLLAKQREEEARRVQAHIDAEVERRAALFQSEFETKTKELIESVENSKVSILSTAMKEAAAITAKANQDAALIKTQAQQSGKEEGFKAGKAEALAQCDEYVKTAAQFLSGINSKKEAYFISLEDELLNTVLDMVKKITLEELKTDKDTIFRILKQAGRTFRNDDYLKISFAEGDVSADVVTDINFIRNVVGSIKDIDIEFLPDAEAGTVIIDNGSEIIDASVPTQLDLLKEILNNSRG